MHGEPSVARRQRSKSARSGFGNLSSTDSPDRPTDDSRASAVRHASIGIRFAHPSGRTELRALLRYAPFLQRLRRNPEKRSVVPYATSVARIRQARPPGRHYWTATGTYPLPWPVAAPADRTLPWCCYRFGNHRHDVCQWHGSNLHQPGR